MKKNIMKEKLLLLGMLQTILLFTGCAQKTEEPLKHTIEMEQDEQNTKSIEEIIEEKKVKYDFTEIEKILNDNIYLTEDEVKMIKKMKFIFDENHEFMDLGLVKERLSKLRIVYSKEKKGGIGGYYDPNKNMIVFFESKNLDDVRIDIFVHEFLHVLQKDFGSFFAGELSNEFFSRETVQRLYDEKVITKEELENISEVNTGINEEPLIFGNGYTPYMIPYYTMAEIVSEDTLRRYQFGGDIYRLLNDIIYDCGSDSAYEPAVNFLNSMNESRIFDKETGEWSYTNAFDYEAETKKCFGYIDECYFIKNGKHIKDDLKVTIINYDIAEGGITIFGSYTPYERDSVESEALKEQLLEKAIQINEEADTFGIRRRITPRTYLSNNHQNPKITFNSPAMVTIEIDDAFVEEFNQRVEKDNKKLKIKYRKHIKYEN